MCDDVSLSDDEHGGTFNYRFTLVTRDTSTLTKLLLLYSIIV